MNPVPALGALGDEGMSSMQRRYWQCVDSFAREVSRQHSGC